jgi:hypothetical protein
MYKLDIPLRSALSSNGCLWYSLAEFLHRILSPSIGNIDSFAKNAAKFMPSIKDEIFRIWTPWPVLM